VNYLLWESTIQFITRDGEQFIKREFGVFVMIAISMDHSWISEYSTFLGPQGLLDTLQ
jgi:hypothetical protein